ncbi:MAG: hypothetical protein FJ033_08740 [Chloroflexi bacterium]|nr:hypothetical protein [Chloroflexota bacterium]
MTVRGSGRGAERLFPTVLLKARPTPLQLNDRVGFERFEGLELYLDRADIEDPECPEAIRRIVERSLEGVSRPLSLLVEGPVRSLDGQFFDLSVDSPANRETLRRVARTGRAIGATTMCIHLIAPRADLRITAAERGESLERCRTLTRFYVELCEDHRLLPTVENIPPIGRMRESAFMTSPVGIIAEDFLELCARVPGTRVTFDTSHASLLVNLLADSPPDPIYADLREDLLRLTQAYSAVAYLDALGSLTTSAHVSDARGVLGEGLEYGAGDAPLDAMMAPLFKHCGSIVAEVLEPDPNLSPAMRRTARVLQTLRDGGRGG